MNTATIETVPSAELDLQIQNACRKIAPLWPLSHFVAVNPFLGYTGQSFDRACVDHHRDQGADMLLPMPWFRDRFASGRIGMENLRAAVRHASPGVVESFRESGEELSAEQLVAKLDKPVDLDDQPFRTGPFSAYLDNRESTAWQQFVRDEAAKWCAAYFDASQSSWMFPWKDLPLYEAWKAAARIDRNPECAGLAFFRSAVAELPDCPSAMIRLALIELEVPAERVPDYLHQVLLTLPGWAGHLRYLDREKELRGADSGMMPQLLATLLAYELILFRNHCGDSGRVLGWKRSLLENPDDTGSPEIPLSIARNLLWQSALEHSVEQDLRSCIHAPVKSGAVERPDAQAVFCIDVRSEVFRRQLEAVNPRIRTLGFAGFFGLPIEHHVPGQKAVEARCPALLAPPLPVASGLHGIEPPAFDQLTFERVRSRESARGWKRFREAAASCFTFVETLGLGYAVKLFRETCGIAATRPVRAGAPAFMNAMEPATRTDLAAGILKGLGLTGNFAPVVLFCGHGSSTRNNPYASGLDCGACGGHAGDANARLAASLLNDPSVRAGLAGRGILIPEDTVFLGGLHDTTTDEVTLFDTDVTADAVALAKLRDALGLAGLATARVRAPRLIASAGDKSTVSSVRSRSRDWSQVRPEWGLAGNAAFIIAPREWTRGSDLQGRAFLHDYDARNDPGGSVLEAIIGGPLVVTNWINLQYYASSVDNAHFGSGNKSIHNVVAGIGVALGNENDLRPGLPFQSVHNGKELMHEPVRLHACIAAEPETVRSILERQHQVAELVRNDWIHLIALGVDGRKWVRI